MYRRKSKVESLGSLIPGRIPAGLSIAMSIAEMVKEWEWVAGQNLAEKSRPVSIERDVLVVVCLTPSIAKVITMKAGGLIRSIEKRWKLGIKGIRVVVGRIEEPREIPPPKPYRIEPSPASIRACLSYTSEKIEDEEIAEALARLMATYMKKFPKGNKKP
ncbi:DciA family protein [Dethiosulfovibrio salsuginis]|uniref:DUF721 domain-containing protein n=1 Tax=Dethiosulfovibrio salsuginis TaxID=561720 RepID=A0A1X7JGR8_9BACT|nr:DciA family protein [Dethiosulfovibrio salsuginis]SMG26478.1 hypothetical protein SAMN06275492_11145 [Dethiosulfovibrio salsuginis]